MRQLFVLRIDSYEGEDTFVRCGNEQQDHLFCIVSVGNDDTIEIVDSSYRSMSEALEAWPNACHPVHNSQLPPKQTT